MKTLVGLFVPIFCCISATNLAIAQTTKESADNPDTKNIIEAIAARNAAMQRIYVSFKIRRTFTPPGVSSAGAEEGMQLDGGARAYISMGTQDGMGSFSYLNGMARYEIHWQPLPNEKKRGQNEWTDIHIYSKERIESLTNMNKKWAGLINKRGTVTLPLRNDPITNDVDAALGLRPEGVDDWVTADALKHMKVVLLDKEQIVLSARAWDSSTCDCTFDRNIGCALTRIRIKDSEGQVGVEIVCSDFRKVENIMLPFKIGILETMWENGKGQESQKVEISIDDYKLKEKENNAGRYRMTFPKGSDVMDVRTNQLFVMDSDAALDDETISRALEAKIKRGQIDRQDAQHIIDSVLATQPATGH